MTDHLAACAADAAQVLAAWTPPDPGQAIVRDRILGYVDQHGPRAADRDLRLGHLTGSAVLLDHTRTQVLLTLHPMIGHWVQLGGHVEPGDTSMADAALREAREESGIDGVQLEPVRPADEDVLLEPVLLGIDWHPVRCKDGRGERNPSQHLDLTYLAVAPAGAAHIRSDESLDLAWFGIDDLPHDADDVLRRLVAAARTRTHP